MRHRNSEPHSRSVLLAFTALNLRGVIRSLSPPPISHFRLIDLRSLTLRSKTMKAAATDPTSLRRLLNQSSRASTPPPLGQYEQANDSPNGNGSPTGFPSRSDAVFSSPSRTAASPEASREALLRVLTSALELIDDEDLDESDIM